MASTRRPTSGVGLTAEQEQLTKRLKPDFYSKTLTRLGGRKAQNFMKDLQGDVAERLEETQKRLDETEKDLIVSAELGQALLEAKNDLIRENEEQKEKICNLEKENARLTTKCLQTTDLETENTSIASRCKLLQGQLRSSEIAVIQLREEILQREDEIQRLSTELCGFNELKAESKLLKQELEGYKTSLEEAEGMEDELVHENKRRKAEIERLTNELRTATSDSNWATEEVKRLHQTMELLQQMTKSSKLLESDVIDLKTQLDTERTAKRELQDRIAQLERVHRELQHKWGQANVLLEKAYGSVPEDLFLLSLSSPTSPEAFEAAHPHYATPSLAEETVASAQRDIAMEALEARANEAEDASASLKASLREAEIRVESLMQRLHESENREENARQRAQEAEEQARVFEAKLFTMEEEAASSISRLRVLQQSVEGLSHQIHESEARERETAKERDALVEECRVKTSAIDEMRVGWLESEKQLDAARQNECTATEAAHQREQELQEALQDQSARARDTIAQLTAAQKRLQEVDTEVRSAGRAARTREADRKQLEALTEQLRQSDARIDGLETLLQETTQRARTSERNAKKQQEQADHFKEDLLAVETANRLTERELSSKETQLKRQLERGKRMAAKLKSAESRVAELEAKIRTREGEWRKRDERSRPDVNALKAEIEELSASKKAVENLVELKEGDLRCRNEVIASLSRRQRDDADKISSLLSRLRAVEERDAHHGSADEWNREMQALHEEVATLKAERITLEEALRVERQGAIAARLARDEAIAARQLQPKRDEIALLEHDLAARMRDLDVTDERLRAAEDENEELCSRLEESEERVRVQASEIERVKKCLQEAQERSVDYEVFMRDLEAQVGEEMAAATKARERAGHLEVSLTNALTRLKQEEEHARSLEELMVEEGHESEVERLSYELAVAEQRTVEWRTKAHEETNRRRAVEQENVALQNQARSAYEEAERRAEYEEELEEILRGRQSHLAAKEELIAAQQATIRDSEERLRSRDAELQAKDETIERHCLRIQSTESRLTAVNARADEMERKLVETHDIVSTKDETNTYLNTKLQESEYQIAQLKEKLRLSQQNVSDLAARVVEMEQHAQRMAKLSSSEEQCHLLQEELNKKGNTLETLRNSLQDLENRALEAENRSRTKSDMIEMLQTWVENAEQELQKQDREMGDLVALLQGEKKPEMLSEETWNCILERMRSIDRHCATKTIHDGTFPLNLDSTMRKLREFEGELGEKKAALVDYQKRIRVLEGQVQRNVQQQKIYEEALESAEVEVKEKTEESLRYRSVLQMHHIEIMGPGLEGVELSPDTLEEVRGDSRMKKILLLGHQLQESEKQVCILSEKIRDLEEDLCSKLKENESLREKARQAEEHHRTTHAVRNFMDRMKAQTAEPSTTDPVEKAATLRRKRRERLSVFNAFSPAEPLEAQKEKEEKDDDDEETVMNVVNSPGFGAHRPSQPPRQSVVGIYTETVSQSPVSSLHQACVTSPGPVVVNEDEEQEEQEEQKIREIQRPAKHRKSCVKLPGMKKSKRKSAVRFCESVEVVQWEEEEEKQKETDNAPHDALDAKKEELLHTLRELLPSMDAGRSPPPTPTEKKKKKKRKETAPPTKVNRSANTENKQGTQNKSTRSPSARKRPPLGGLALAQMQRIEARLDRFNKLP